jgi:transcriptional regulator with XRE-family HTH domain
MPAAHKTINGAALRAWRLARGLKFRHVEERLAQLGGATAGRSHLCNIEKGRRDANEALIGALATVLDVPVAALRYGTTGEVASDPAA